MIEQILIISLTCMSIHFLTREGSIFGFYQKIVIDERGELRSDLLNPFTECIACMASFWTCFDFLMTDSSVESIQFIFFSTFFVLLMTSFLLGESLSVMFKVMYLTLVLCFVMSSDNPYLILTVMICVHGLNAFISKVVVFYDDCQELRDMRDESQTDS